MAYDLKQWQALAASGRDELFPEVPSVTSQPGRAVELELWPQSRLYNVAYKPTDDQPSPGRANKKSPPARPNEKSSPKRANRRPPPTDAEVESSRKKSKKDLLRFVEPRPEEAKARMLKSLAKLERLKDEIARLHSRMQGLDPKLQEGLVDGDFRVELDHLTEQLAELTAKARRHPHRFELAMERRYDAIIDRITRIDQKLNDLENPPSEWSDKIPKTLESIKRSFKQSIESIKLP